MKYSCRICSFLLCVTVTVMFLSNVMCQDRSAAYKIGAILPLTGPAASFGELWLRGLQLAIDEINNAEKLPKNIELLVEDGQADPKTSVAAFMKLSQSNVKIMMTLVSSVSMALAPKAAHDEVVLFADAAHPGITGQSKFVFRHSNTSEQEADIIGNFVTDSLRVSTIALIIVNDDYGVSLKNAFENIMKTNGLSITSIQFFEKNETDFRPFAQKITNANPQAVFIVGYGKGLGLTVRKLREIGYKKYIITSIGFVATPDAQIAAGDYAKGVYYDDFEFNYQDSLYRVLKEKYETKYGQQMPTFVHMAFNSLMLIAEALKHSGYKPEQIAEYILKMEKFNSAGEELTINAKGDALPKLTVKRY